MPELIPLNTLLAGVFEELEAPTRMHHALSVTTTMRDAHYQVTTPRLPTARSLGGRSWAASVPTVGQLHPERQGPQRLGRIPGGPCGTSGSRPSGGPCRARCERAATPTTPSHPVEPMISR